MADLMARSMRAVTNVNVVHIEEPITEKQQRAPHILYCTTNGIVLSEFLNRTRMK